MVRLLSDYLVASHVHCFGLTAADISQLRSIIVDNTYFSFHEHAYSQQVYVRHDKNDNENDISVNIGKWIIAVTRYIPRDIWRRNFYIVSELLNNG